jgi:hypothetical protein
MSGHVQEVLALLESGPYGLTGPPSTPRTPDVNLEMTLQSTATLVSTAASIIETRSSQSASIRAPSVSGLPLTKDQRISIAKWIPEPTLSEELPMEQITSHTLSSASSIQRKSKYEFAKSEMDGGKITWVIQNEESKPLAQVGRMECYTSMKPLSIYLYLGIGADEHPHVATINRGGLFRNKWTLILPDSGVLSAGILLAQGHDVTRIQRQNCSKCGLGVRFHQSY